ncbi:ABC transporter ATP-binding protein [Terrabacter tumescens]|uniref:ABC transporter ATP-binding protein n=1 Tax=Terrabacter tumescens TaxID=60443 RepID=A0ABQ2IF55_9MICO|nr:ABC transporter ATP-binding protein [Terrabacter tumescens]GGN08022.1 ABC transporter ATP-binding protein [Terrabacter tumescens]
MSSPAPTPRPALAVSCEDVARTFGRGERAVVAVHGSSCEVPFGSRIAIVGPSGSGKSTMLHMMAGLETPTAGRVSWPGLPDVAERRGQIGVVFQSPSLVPALTVVENVALPLVLDGVPDAEAQERVTEALELVQVTELATQLPEELSGGQAQRVAVARVLASRPSLILADEPTGQLDRANGQHLVEVLLATAEQLDAALVISTHDIEVADRLQERWRMHEGRLKTDEAGLKRTSVPRATHADTTTAGGQR